MRASRLCISVFHIAHATGYAWGNGRASLSSQVPWYALVYAPVVYLDQTDPYRPSDIGAQLVHTVPRINGTLVADAPSPLTLDNLAALNVLGGSEIYLTATDDFALDPPWLNGVVPDSSGKTVNATSCAVITHDRGNATVDVFYFFFYAYNKGNDVLVFEVGDHVGDWEHNMIRFVNGIPETVWLSQHSNGMAFTYEAMEKENGRRVVGYSSNGGHTNYATASVHNRTIPNVTLPNGAVFSLPQGDLFDLTTRGPRWDPLLNAYFYSVSFDTEPTTATVAAPSPTFTALPNPIDCASSLWWSTWWNKKPTPTLPPVDWLYFKGQWGDQQLSDLDPRQVDLFGYAYKYESGPTGPEDKNLARNKGVCLDSSDGCPIATALYSGA